MVILVWLLVGCSGAPQPAPYKPSQVDITRPVMTSPSNESPEKTGLTLQSGELIFTILTPADGAIVTSSPIELIVISNIETVVTIDGNLFVVADGMESAFLVSLEEGYNTIELVASDYKGDQVETIMSVIYAVGEWQ
jgi:hypothetical protein